MATVKLLEVPISGMDRLLEETRQAGLDQLKAILACTFTFDGGYFEQFLKALAELHPDGTDRLREIPVDVICDHRHYRGHGFGYNVHCWPGDNLFHPKLLMLLFTDRLVWLEGSQNLTRAGYALNRELVSFHKSRKNRFPPGVAKLVGRLAQLRIASAEKIWKVTTGAREQSMNRSITSLDRELLAGMMSRVRKASDVYVVAPFFDRREQVGVSIETSALKRLADQYPEAKFWVFLPQIETADGHHELQASRQTFAKAFGYQAPMSRLALCGVPSDKQPLHAKLLGIRYGQRDATVTILVGSPNLTEVALLKKGSNANVELAREITGTWSWFERLLKPLEGRFKKFADCRFNKEPLQVTSSGWHALESAIYNPLRQDLQVKWRRSELAWATRVCYGGKPLKIMADGRYKGFAIKQGEYRLETICRKDPSRRSWCPIVIPLETRLALGSLPEGKELPPEWWLAQLGSLPLASPNGESSPPLGNIHHREAVVKFELGTRIRDLASRMRYASDVIVTSSVQDNVHVTAHLDLLQKIFDTHEPVNSFNSSEDAWRMWVRLELTQMLVQASKATGNRRVRMLANAFRAGLSATFPPPETQRQWQALTGSLQ